MHIWVNIPTRMSDTYMRACIYASSHQCIMLLLTARLTYLVTMLSAPPNTLSNQKRANSLSPGVPTHLPTLFPFILLSHPPLSPTTSSSVSPPFLRVLRSTTIIPLVHCPTVSTLISSPSLMLHSCFPKASSRSNVRAYHTVRGSWRSKAVAPPECPWWRVSMVKKVGFMKPVTHSARGEPACKREAVASVNSSRRTVWRPVISRGNRIILRRPSLPNAEGKSVSADG